MKAFTRLIPNGISFSLGKAKKTVVLTAASLILLVSGTSFAGPISGLNIFGDSLSDAGAFKTLAPEFCPPSPYFDCRFSNGPVWAEILAADLGVTASPAYAGGSNWAIGGQRTDQILNDQVPIRFRICPVNPKWPLVDSLAKLVVSHP